MSQTTLDTFFSARKKVGPNDQHASKKRKVLASSGSGGGGDGSVEPNFTTTEAVTSAKDDHGHGKLKLCSFDDGEITATAPESLLSTPKSAASTKPENKRTSKRDLSGADKSSVSPDKQLQQKTLFNVGKNEKLSGGSNVKRRLNLSLASGKIPFILAGSLSPSKKNVSSDDEASTKNKSEAQKVVEKVEESLSTKFTPQDVKAKLGKVNKLSDLQAQLRNLNKDKNIVGGAKPKHKRALFDDAKASPLTLEVEVSKPVFKSPIKSPLKASPRKTLLPAFVKYSDLSQPDKYLPLPSKYKYLSEVFRNVDQIVSMKFNRKEMIRVDDLKPAIQNIMRRTFDNHYLRQVRCVLPKAYAYVWEKIRDRLGRHTGNYELHMSPGDVDNQSLTPHLKVQRLKLFQHSLLSIVKDCHHDFLQTLGIHVEEQNLTKWHRDFDVESCPEIDTVDFPPKPYVEKLSTAKEMIAKLAGANPRLEAVLGRVGQQDEDPPPLPSPGAADAPKPALKKGLQGLPQHLIDKILAKEKEKRIRDMTQCTHERKDVEMLNELVVVAPIIVNCHRNQNKGAAVPIDTLCDVTADSYGRKSKIEMMELIKKFLQVVPDCMEIKLYDKIEYVKRKKDSPDVNAVRARVKAMAAKLDATK